MITSFEALAAKGARAVLIGVCTVAFVAMFVTANQESAIMDELAHIPAGYGYVRHLDFRLNPEHPPLLKALSGLPLLFLQPNFPTNVAAWETDVNGQWDMGAQFLYHSGNDPAMILRLARLAPMLLTILLVILVFLWSSELMGRIWALVPTVMVAFSPNILAHGRYVTTDIAAMFGILLATYTFVHLLNRPTRKNLLLAGLGFGVAQAGKFSAVLLVPFFGLLALVVAGGVAIRRMEHAPLGAKWKAFFGEAARTVGRTIAVFVIGFVLVIYPLYFIFTVNEPIERQVSDTSIILASFANGPTPAGAICKPARCLADATIWSAGNPVLRPFSEYALGVLMVLQRASGGNTNYFLGQVSNSGWHYYFPVVYAIKEPLPIVILVVIALLGGLARIFATLRRNARARTLLSGFADWLGTHTAEFAMIVFTALYWAWSMNSPLNIGFRHLFPTIPFIAILTAGFWKSWVLQLNGGGTPSSAFQTLVAGAKAIMSASVKYAVFVFLMLWFLAESIFAAPYYLSYFNQLGGGTWFGYRYVTDSNYDWGQDMARLKTFVENHAEIDRIGVDYFGGASPKFYLGDKEENWWSARGNPVNEGIHWLAVSVNTLQGATQPTTGGFTRKSEDEYRWLTGIRAAAPGMGNVPEPDYRVGTSIFVYKL